MEKTKLCVIGDPIEHSLSPVIHNTILEMLGLPYEYGRMQVRAEDTETFLRQAVTEGYGGFNATMPHKTNLVKLADELDYDAQLCQSVNTVVIRGGKICGCNTDGKGFLRMLQDHGFSPEKKTITVLGAGGAARAIVLKLAQAGAARIFVCNRTLAKAETLAREAPAQISACAFDGQTLSDCAMFSDLLVNTTPLGMEKINAQFTELGFLNLLGKHAPVCDVVYQPVETAFLRYAREYGHQTINGLGMLVHQAIFALEEFTETKIDPAAVVPEIMSALKKAMQE